MNSPIEEIAADDDFLNGIDGWRPFLLALGDAFSEVLSDQTSSPVTVELQFSGSRVLSQYALSLKPPTFLHMLEMDRGDNWFVNIELPVIYSILNGVLGTSDAESVHPDRDPTNVEIQLAERAIGAVLQSLLDRWGRVDHLEMLKENVLDEVASLYQPPAQIIEVVQVDFKVHVGLTVGLINISIPKQAVVSAASGIAQLQNLVRFDTAHDVNAPSRTLEITARLKPFEITTDTLANLKLGDIILSEQSVEEPIEIYVDDERLFLAEPVSLEGKKAARILSRESMLE